MLLAEGEQSGQIERSPGVERLRLIDPGFALGFDLQPPGLGGEPGFDEGVARERVRLRVAAADVGEVVGIGQERATFGHEIFVLRSSGVARGRSRLSHAGWIQGAR